jgi:hypothetical protein
MGRTIMAVTGAGVALATGAATVVACQASYTLNASVQPTETYGPSGATLTVQVTSAPAGQVVSFAPVPSAISVAPSNVTADPNGNAVAYALVPYGTEGVLVASAPESTPKSIYVQASPLTLCPPVVEQHDAGDIGATGQVYTVSVQALTTGGCANPGNAQAPAGVPITITTSQPGASSSASSGSDGGAPASSGSSSAVLLTGDNGQAVTNLQLPWGANVVVQATGGGGISETSVTANANPATVPCLSWSQAQSGIYQVSAVVVDGMQPIPAAPVNFSVVLPSAGAATLTPASALTNQKGVATTLLVVPDAGSFPVVVAAVVASSSITTTIDGGPSGSSGQCQ